MTREPIFVGEEINTFQNTSPFQSHLFSHLMPGGYMLVKEMEEEIVCNREKTYEKTSVIHTRPEQFDVLAFSRLSSFAAKKKAIIHVPERYLW